MKGYSEDIDASYTEKHAEMNLLNFSKSVLQQRQQAPENHWLKSQRGPQSYMTLYTTWHRPEALRSRPSLSFLFSSP